MKILEEFWYGNIHPTDRNIVTNSKMDRRLKLVVQNEQRLTELLSEEEWAAFQKFKESQDELSSVNERESFTLGFRLGARFMLEGLGEMDILFATIPECCLIPARSLQVAGSFDAYKEAAKVTWLLLCVRLKCTLFFKQV